HPGGETVSPVEEVDRVLHPDEPEDADPDRDRKGEVDDVAAGQAEVPDLKVEREHRQQRQADLHGQLDDWTHRRAVIDDEKPRREPGDDQQAERLQVVWREREDRGPKTKPHRQAAEHRGRVDVSMPRVVTRGVPTRTPLGLNFDASSKGMELRLSVMPTVSAKSCTCLPVRFCGRRSMSIRWLSVPPLTRRRPRSISRSAIALALTTTCFAYTLKSGLSASPKQTALAAMACINGPPCVPGKTAESIAFCQSLRQR